MALRSLPHTLDSFMLTISNPTSIKDPKGYFAFLGAMLLTTLKVELGFFGPTNRLKQPFIEKQDDLNSVSLDTATERIQFFYRIPRWEVGDFQVTYRVSPTDWEPGAWHKWEELKDMKELAWQIREGRPGG